MMKNLKTNNRRDILKLFSAMPLLPLAGGLSGFAITACAGGSSAQFVSASFTGMSSPSLADPAAMSTTTVASSVKVSLSNGQAVDYKLAYQPFFITGSQVPDGKGGTLLAGGYYDSQNNAIIDKTVLGKERQFFSDSPDGTSLIKLTNPTVTGVKGNTVFAVVQFEYTTWA
jgi:uncharacterized protein